MVWEQAVMIFFIGSIFALFYVALNLDQIHILLKWLLFSLGIFFMAIASYFTVYLMETNITVNAQYYTLPLVIITVWLVVLFIFYFGGFFLWQLFKSMLGWGKNEKKS